MFKTIVLKVIIDGTLGDMRVYSLITIYLTSCEIILNHLI